MNCSPPGCSIHGNLQARILQWVVISFSRGSSWCRDQTPVSLIVGRCFNLWTIGLVQFSSVSWLWPTHCDPMDCSMPGFPVHHQLPKLAQTHVRWVGDAIQPSNPLLSPSPPSFNLSQHQGLFQWVSSLHQVAKVLALQHQSFQWIFRTDFL